MDQFSAVCANFGLIINTKKTQMLHQLPPHHPYVEPLVTINGEVLNAVDKLTYLGSVLSRDVHIDKEVDAHIARTSSVFGRLQREVWEGRGIRLTTKLKVYRAIVLTSSFYACETWTVYQCHARKLNHFHLNYLRKILRITWQDKLPDTEVLALGELPSIQTML